MATITENLNRPGAHILRELDVQMSREAGVTITGGNYKAGTVMAKITASGKLTQLNPSANDGSEKACAVLYRDVDASAGDKPGTVNSCLAIYHGYLLGWPNGITDAQKAKAIEDLGERFQKVG
ncbi:head decoration protein (plasmid) [Microbulbifer sp. ANSA001]|uniref:head decoration protein n=1 Tax=Microbulbifer sp. ANSA001 TaxID=3243358 RepID=UPI0040431F1F